MINELADEFLHSPIADELFSSIASIKEADKLIELDIDDQATQKQAKQAITTAVEHARRHIASEGARIALVSGEAGTGKSHLLVTGLKEAAFDPQSGVFPVTLQLTAPVTIEDYEKWLISAIFRELASRYFETEDNRAPLQRLAEALLAKATKKERLAFQHYADQDKEEQLIEQARKIARKISRDARSFLSEPVSAGVIAALLLANIGDQAAMNFLQKGTVSPRLAKLDLSPLNNSTDRLGLIRQLDLILQTIGGILVISFDQVEQMRKLGDISLLDHAFRQITNIAVATQNTALVITIISDVYDELTRASTKLNQSDLDRIENEIPLITRLKRPSKDFLKTVIIRRLFQFAKQLNALQNNNEWQLIPEWLLEKAVNTPRVRTALATIADYRALGKKLKRLPTQAEFDAEYETDTNITSPSRDWPKEWADFKDRQNLTEQNYLSKDKALFLANYVSEAVREHESLDSIPAQFIDDTPKQVDYNLQIDGTVLVHRQIAICDAPNQKNKLRHQIEQFLDQATGEPVVVAGRKSGFPKGDKSQPAKALQRVKTLKGFKLELSSQEWLNLDHALQFIQSHQDETGFLDWRRQEKWLLQLFPPLKDLIAIPSHIELDNAAAVSDSEETVTQTASPETHTAEPSGQATNQTKTRAQQDNPQKPWVSPDEPAKMAKSDEQTPSHSLMFPLLIGHDEHHRPIFWDPEQSNTNPLNNFGFLVTGDAGSGKTQTINCLIAACCQAQHAVTIFDFKADYWQPEFVDPLGLQVYDLRTQGLPFNPLQPPPEGPSGAQPIAYTYELKDLLGKIFRLGDQQANQLQQALAAAYEEAGIKLREWVQPNQVSWPSFTRVLELMKERYGDNNPAAMRVQQLVDLQLFPPEYGTTVDFERFMQGRLSLKFSDLPSDAIKAALAELLIVQIHGYAMRRAQPKKLQHLLVFDEAHRVASNKKLETLVREGRAFGIGVVLGTQFPGDVPPEVAGNLATHLYLMNNQARHRRTVVEQVFGSLSNSEAQALLSKVSRFQQFQGLFSNVQYDKAIVHIMPYFRRSLYDE